MFDAFGPQKLHLFPVEPGDLRHSHTTLSVLLSVGRILNSPFRQKLLQLADLYSPKILHVKMLKEAWELYQISSGLYEKDNAIQIATVQRILGTKARQVLNTLPNIPREITQGTVEDILTVLETYCVPRKNATVICFLEEYNRMSIQEDHLFDIFVPDLRRRAEYCDFRAIL